MNNASTPLVSIITPTFDHEKHIGQCIGSVLDQSYPNWEQIVIDDGSRDGTGEAVRQFSDPRIHYFFQSNKGIEQLAQTYNSALARCRGTLIAILEGDDYWPQDKLSTLVPVFSNPELALAYGGVADVSPNGEWSGRIPRSVRIRRSLPNSILLNDPIGLCTPYLLRADGADLIPPATVIIRRAALDEIGGFQYVPNLCVTDYPTYLRLSQVGKFAYTPKVMGFRRRHQHSASLQHGAQIARLAGEHASDFIRQRVTDLTANQLHAIKMSWQQAGYLHHFSIGRLNLCNKKWKWARRHFAQALNPRMPRVFAASSIGWVFSWIQVDMESLMSLFGVATLEE